MKIRIEFYWCADSGMNYQWYMTLEEND